MSTGIVFVSQQLQASQTAVPCPLTELHFKHASNPFAVTNSFMSWRNHVQRSGLLLSSAHRWKVGNTFAAMCCIDNDVFYSSHITALCCRDMHLSCQAANDLIMSA